MRFLVLLAFLGFTIESWALQWQFRSDLSDEFSETTIGNRWQTKHPTYEGRPPGIDTVDNITIKDGWLSLSVSKHPRAGKYFTSGCRLTKEITYGFFETRAQIPQGHVNSAFWLYKWRPSGTREIDIFEMSYGHEHLRNLFMSNYHVFDGNAELQTPQNTLSNSIKIPLKIDTHSQAHTYGFAWTPEKLTWFINGDVVREEANLHFHQPMHVVLTAQVHPKWMGLPKESDMPTSFKVDYVRVWDYVPNTASSQPLTLPEGAPLPQ